MHKEIRFYTTAGCHLCEQALAMCHYVFQAEPLWQKKFSLLEVEIVNSDALVEQYGIRIPVLECSGKELGWPFELGELSDWLQQL